MTSSSSSGSLASSAAADGCRSSEAAFLFTDIEGSTSHWDAEPDAMREAVADHDEILLTAVQEETGRAVKSTGDGLFAAFTTVASAVRAALTAQQRLDTHAWPTTGPVRVRMGVHVGVAEQRGDDWYGREVNLAARVANAGHGGDVLLSDAAATRWRIDGGTARAEPSTLMDLGAYRLSGIARPERLFAARRSGPPHRTLRALPVDLTNLPVELDEYVGREAERRQLADLLAAHRVVTLVGPGGAGKTRLAVRVGSEHADRVPDGVWFADLQYARDATQVTYAIAEATGLVASPGRPLEDQLTSHLRAKQCLLLVDNCEQVADSVAELVERLLTRAPNVKVLATSRVVLDVPGETVMRLAELGVPDHDAPPERVLESAAARLFVARAAQSRPDLPIGPNDASAVATVCRAVDGLPLGIELAAAQLRAVDLADLPSHLAVAGGRLKGGRRRRTTRHGSLGDVMAASYQLLDEDERRVFESLAVFAGSFAPSAVARIADVEPDLALDVVASLVDQSMVVPIRSDRPTRFRLLETLRRFAMDRLELAGAIDTTRDRHLAWALDLIADLEAAMRTAHQDEALLRTRAEHDNLRAARARALELGDEVSALRITASAPIDPETERDNVIGALLATADGVPADVRARSLYTCGSAALERGDWRRVQTFAREAATLFEDMGDESQATYAEFLEAFGRWGSSPGDSLDDQMTRMLTRFEAHGDRMGAAYSSWILSQWLLDHSPDDPRVAKLADEAIEGFTAVDATFGLAHAREGLAYVQLRAGRTAEAAASVLEAIEAFHASGHPSCLAHTLDAAGVLLVDVGRPRDATELLGAAIGLRQATGVHMRPWEQERHTRCMHAIEKDLDTDTRVEALAAGGRLDADAAAARAAALVRPVSDAASRGPLPE